MKLLIVEDAPELIEVMKVMINPNIDATFAEDFGSVVEYFKTNTPDVVVTDFYFPGGNGHQVADLAREKGVSTIYLNSSDSGIQNDGGYTGKLKKDDADQFMGLFG